jgi:hypothetical protein
MKHRRSISSINGKVSYLRSCGFDIPQSACFWTDEATLLLKEEYPKFGRNSPKLLNLGYSKEEIDQKARRENIKFIDAMEWTPWTEEEDAWLNTHYTKDASVSQIVTSFKEAFSNTSHTDAAIKARMKTLRLSTIENVRYWTKEEDELVLTYYATMGTDCVTMFTGRTKDQIKQRARTLGVRTSGPKNRKSIKCIESGVIFSSGREAASWATGKPCKDSGSIGQALKKGSGALAYGYHWEYVEE